MICFSIILSFNFSQLSIFLIYFHIKPFYIFLMTNFQLADNFHPNKIGIANNEGRTHFFKFFVFKINHFFDAVDLFLILSWNDHNSVIFICKLCFKFKIVVLFYSKHFFDVFNDLVGTLQLLQTILMCIFFTTNLLFKKKYLFNVFFIAVAQGLCHWVRILLITNQKSNIKYCEKLMNLQSIQIKRMASSFLCCCGPYLSTDCI